MNVKPIEYRGQVLLAFEVEEDKSARVGKKQCPIAEEPESVEYEFRLDLFQVISRCILISSEELVTGWRTACGRHDRVHTIWSRQSSRRKLL